LTFFIISILYVFFAGHIKKSGTRRNLTGAWIMPS